MDTAYFGAGLNDGLTTKVDTKEECSALCRQHDKCVVWTWISQGGEKYRRTFWIRSTMSNECV